MPRFWLATVSKDHVLRGKEWGICQVCHGKKAPLARMKQGDYLLYYSPKQSRDGEKLQTFTAAAKMTDNEIYQAEQFPGFTPFRKNAEYYPHTADCPLDQVRSHPDWPDYAAKIRFGHFEISRDFFLYVFGKMKTD